MTMTRKTDGNATDGAKVARNDLDELKVCMWRAIERGLDVDPLPPEKGSVALAVAIHAHLDGAAWRVERFVEELQRCVEQRTGQQVQIARDPDIDVDAAEARMRDEEVEDLYIYLNEDAFPEGILDYEDGDEARNPTPEAYTLALSFAVAMCLKHDVSRVERFMRDLRAEHCRTNAYEVKYSPAWSRGRVGNA
jgi:hypothetical protein